MVPGSTKVVSDWICEVFQSGHKLKVIGKSVSIALL